MSTATEIMIPPQDALCLSCELHETTCRWRGTLGFSCVTYEPAAQQLGAVQNMEDYTLGFQEAVEFSDPRKLRTLLATRINFGIIVRDM